MPIKQFFKRMIANAKTPNQSYNNLWLNLLIIPSIASYWLFDTYFLSISNSDGQSMQPTIKPGDLLIIDKFFYKLFGGIKKNDIIVATQPVNPTVNICKRIIETGGNQVPNKKGIIVPENFYWIEGDNTFKSYDSRHHGCIPANLIKGKVICILQI